MTEKIIRVGHSPDPDDAFMFFGLSSGKVKIEGVKIKHQLEDIQTLNQRAMEGDLEVTAISAHTYPFVEDKYWIMETGGSFGENYGPVIVSKKYKSLSELKGKKIATPGKLTTATLLFKIFCEGIENTDIPFDEIMNKVNDETFDAGLLIHEGQLTYKDEGFNKILDFGELWNEKTNGLPLPLGLDVVRKDLGIKLAKKISFGLKESIHFGYTHQSESIPYSMQWGRGIDSKLGEKFVKMYVNELTISMGEIGKQSLELLFKLAKEKKLISNFTEINLI